nr:type II and III secretion system protein family protein [Paraburkholderia caffeinitolerans]
MIAAACVAFTALIVTAPGGAQELAESAALTKGAATAPMQMGKGPMQMTISMGPTQANAGAPKAVAGPLRGPSCVGEIRGERNVVVPLGKSILVPVDEPVRNRTLGNPEIAQATMVSPQTLYLVGQSVGTTNMIVQGRSGACQVIDVIVSADAGGLQAALAQLMPEERGIRVSTAADNLVLAGHVSNAQAAQQATEIAKVFGVSNPGANGAKNGGVINMLTVDSPQQVMLEVKVAEVNKTLIDQLGSAVNIQGGFGSWTGALVSNLLAGVSSAIGFSKANNNPLKFAVDAQKTDQLVKILAEPNLVTISGQEATFLAGGKVFIPVPQSSGNGSTTITLQEEEFGVGLRFTPTVLGNGHINLRVAPEVSELSPTGVTLTAANVSGQTILPLITTRRASTTIQMADGESFAIGGLISNNITGSLKAVPGLGEIPVLGALLRSTSFQQDRTELIFIVTPHLVQPVKSLAQLPLPTDSFTQVNEADVYATGVMEGRGARNQGRFAPAPVAQPGQPAALPQPAGSPQPVPTTPTTPTTPAAPAAIVPAAPAARAVTVGEHEPNGVPPDTVVAQAIAAPPVSAAPLASPDTRPGDTSAANAARIEQEAARIASANADTAARSH